MVHTSPRCNLIYHTLKTQISAVYAASYTINYWRREDVKHQNLCNLPSADGGTQHAPRVAHLNRREAPQLPLNGKFSIPTCFAICTRAFTHERSPGNRRALAYARPRFREEQLRGLKCSEYDLLARSDVRRRLVRGE